MEKNLNSGELVKALIEVQAELMPLMMDQDGHNYRYLGLPEILRVSKPILSKNKVLLQQFSDFNGDEKKVTVNTMLLCTSNDFMRCGGTLGPTRLAGGANETQMLGASCTYLRRFQAMTILGLIGDDDGEEDFTGDPPQKTSVKEDDASLEEPVAEKAAIIQAMVDLVADPVFVEADKVSIRKSIGAAGDDIDKLKVVFRDVHEAYDEKKAKAEPTQKELIDE